MCWLFCGNAQKFSPILVGLVSVSYGDGALQLLVIQNGVKCTQHQTQIDWISILESLLLLLRLTCPSFWRSSYFFVLSIKMKNEKMILLKHIWTRSNGEISLIWFEVGQKDVASLSSRAICKQLLMQWTCTTAVQFP